MEETTLQKLPSKAKNVWRIRAVIEVIVSVLIGGGIIFLLHKFDGPTWITWVIVAAIILEMILFIFVIPIVRWNIWRYEVREQEIEIQSGLFVVKRTLIPMIRVQHVDTEQGPILKANKLANISISTAATKHVIPMLELNNADRLREKISEWARVAEEDV